MADSTKPGIDIVEITSFASDLDIQATYGRPARHIEVITAGAGALVLRCASSTADRTLTVYDKWARALQVTHIRSAGTSVTKVQLTF